MNRWLSCLCLLIVLAGYALMVATPVGRMLDTLLMKLAGVL